MVYGMERYKLGDICNERYYMLPKSLFENSEFDGLSLTSKVAYAVLKDRLELSLKNGWHEDNGDVFFLFKQEELADVIGISARTVVTCIKELKKFGLIDVKRQGLKKPNKLYINKLPIFQFKKCKNFTSENEEVALQEMKDLHANDTDKSDTDRSDTESSNATLFFDTLPDGKLKDELLEFRKSRKKMRKPTNDNIERRVYEDIVDCFGDDMEAAIKQVGISVKRGWLDVVYEDTKEKYLRSKQAAKPRYNPMNPSGSRYTEKELDDLNLPF